MWNMSSFQIGDPSNKGKQISAKQVRYFPLVPRLQRDCLVVIIMAVTNLGVLSIKGWGYVLMVFHGFKHIVMY